MRRWIWFFIKAVLFVLLVLWISQSPETRGYVHVEWIGWQLDTEFWVLMLALILLALLIDWGIRLIRGTRRLPGLVRNASSRSRMQRGYKALSQGLVAVAAGDRDMARELAAKAESLLQNPPLTRLLSAQAAQLNGDEAAAERYFREMLENPDTAFLGARGLLLAAIRRHDYGEALMLARKAHDLQPNSRWVLRQLVELECRSANWVDSEALVKRASANGTFSEDEGKSLLVGVLTEHAREASAYNRSSDAVDYLRQALSVRPDFTPAVVEMGRVQKARGSLRTAEKYIERAYRAQAHPHIAEVWLEISEARDVQGRLAHAKRLLEWAPDAAASHMVVAEAALDAGKLAECRRHLDQVRTPDRTRRYWTLAITLEQASGEDSDRLTEVLRHAADAPQDPVWQCTETGMEQAEWTLVSQGGAFHSLTWLQRQARPAASTVKTEEAASAAGEAVVLEAVK